MTQGFQKYITLGSVVDSSRGMVLGVPECALGGRDDKVMVQVVIYMSCTTNFIL